MPCQTHLCMTGTCTCTTGLLVGCKHAIAVRLQVKLLPWICPVCRGICNCSVRSCQRFQNSLEMTGQLHSEAYHLGYDSVRAHVCKKGRGECYMACS